MILGHLDLKDALALRATCRINKIRSYDGVERLLFTRYYFRLSDRRTTRLQRLPSAFLPQIQHLVFETEAALVRLFAASTDIQTEYRQLRCSSRDTEKTHAERIQSLANVLVRLKHVASLQLGALDNHTRFASLIKEEIRCNDIVANIAVTHARIFNKNLREPTRKLRMLLSAMRLVDFTCRRLAFHNVVPYVLHNDDAGSFDDWRSATRASLKETRTVFLDLLWNVRHTKQMHSSSAQLVTTFLKCANNLSNLELRISLGGACSHLDERSGFVSETGKPDRWTAEIGELSEQLCYFEKFSKIRINIRDMNIPPQSLCKLIIKLGNLQHLTLRNIVLSGDQWGVIFSTIPKLKNLERLSLAKLRIAGAPRAQRRDLWVHKVANEDERLREIEPTRKYVWRGAQMIQQNMEMGLELFESRAG